MAGLADGGVAAGAAVESSCAGSAEAAFGIWSGAELAGSGGEDRCADFFQIGGGDEYYEFAHFVGLGFGFDQHLRVGDADDFCEGVIYAGADGIKGGVHRVNRES